MYIYHLHPGKPCLPWLELQHLTWPSNGAHLRSGVKAAHEPGLDPSFDQLAMGHGTYGTIFGWMNIHKSHLFWCSLGVQGFDPWPVKYTKPKKKTLFLLLVNSLSSDHSIPFFVGKQSRIEILSKPRPWRPVWKTGPLCISWGNWRGRMGFWHK